MFFEFFRALIEAACGLICHITETLSVFDSNFRALARKTKDFKSLWPRLLVSQKGDL